MLTGHCLPYGEGVTFWPLRELVRQAGAPEGTRDQLQGLLADQVDAARVAEQLPAGRPPQLLLRSSGRHGGCWRRSRGGGRC